MTLAPLLSEAMQVQSLSAGKLSLRLYGGLNFFDGGDLNRGLKGWLDLWDYTAGLGGMPGEKDFTPARRGMLAGADIMVPLGSRLALGLGAAYVRSSATSRAIYPDDAVIPSDQTIKASPWAVPLRAGLYCFFPVSSRFEISFHAGAAYYLARVEVEYRRDWDDYWEEDIYNLRAGGPGFHGGLGLEIRLNRLVAILFESEACYARISGFSGNLDRTSSEGGELRQEGSLYLVDYKLAEDAVFTLIDVLDQEPSGPAFVNVKKAVVDFSGFALNLGLTLKF